MRKKGDALSNLGSCLQVLPYHPFQGRTCDVKRLGQLSFIHFPAGVRVCCGAAKIFMGNKSSPLCTFLKVRVCVAMKAPVGLLSGRTVCDSRWRGLAPTSSRRPRQTRIKNIFPLNMARAQAEAILNRPSPHFPAKTHKSLSKRKKLRYSIGICISIEK